MWCCSGYEVCPNTGVEGSPVQIYTAFSVEICTFDVGVDAESEVD